MSFAASPIVIQKHQSWFTRSTTKDNKLSHAAEKIPGHRIVTKWEDFSSGPTYIDHLLQMPGVTMKHRSAIYQHLPNISLFPFRHHGNGPMQETNVWVEF